VSELGQYKWQFFGFFSIGTTLDKTKGVTVQRIEIAFDIHHDPKKTQKER